MKGLAELTETRLIGGLLACLRIGVCPPSSVYPGF